VRVYVAMGKLIYSMAVSLDGFIAGPSGEFDWSAPDEELHRFHNKQTREAGMHLLGRRLYEVMTYWETAEERESISDYEREFARIWKAAPKLVYSTTLDDVVGNARLVRAVVADEILELKQEEKDLTVGGPGLASDLIKLGLVDEYRLFVNPTIVGGGTPFFPALEERIDLELVETRTFGSRVVYLRYSLSPARARP
jgi:dihydrofolate reductase